MSSPTNPIPAVRDQDDQKIIDDVSYLINECGYSSVLPIDKRRYAAVNKFMFTTAIIVGKWDDKNTYDDRWCYSDQRSALSGLLDWALVDFAGEPSGWHRHPNTGRRRPDGDPTQEYINR